MARAIKALMLRDFVYDPSSTFLRSVLSDFDIKPKYPIAILRFEVITPDSFMWRLLVDGVVCYLYAEDYISGLQYVKEVFNKYLQSTTWELMPVQRRVAWEKASPVAATYVYAKPKDSDDFMKYAAESGYDFVFLCKSTEDATEALFSDQAPRGFDHYWDISGGNEPGEPQETAYLRDTD